MPPKRPVSPTGESDATTVYSSEAIHDRDSIFVGYYAPGCTRAKDLQARDDVKSASHRVAAWRLPSSQQTLLSSSRPLYRSGHDDDGEEWAGRKLEKVLEEANVDGVVMVARWYGGILLGPVRFKHIEDVAKNAIDAWRSKDSGPSAKKLRNDSQAPVTAATTQTMTPKELQKRKSELIDVLQQRDESIMALRRLLDQKKNAKPSASPQSSAASSPAQKMNYQVMPLNRLQALENARDMSISFLLKEIDKAEADALKAKVEASKVREAEAAAKARELQRQLEEAQEAAKDMLENSGPDEDDYG